VSEVREFFGFVTHLSMLKYFVKFDSCPVLPIRISMLYACCMYAVFKKQIICIREVMFIYTYIYLLMFGGCRASIARADAESDGVSGEDALNLPS
jgi:hypothetical protein